MSKRTRTPCIGICSTTYGDEVCRGCKRFSYEIINWNSFSPEEKEAIWKRLEKLKTQIMSSRVKIFDSELMNKGIKKYRLRVKDDLNDSSKAFEIIKQVSESFEDLMDFGIELFNKEKSLKDLKDDIEIELYTLSKAHYSKYFLEPLKIKKII
tara:strand:- start:344 stop:802 length:459 start_codon:yes stop_codon:yes gene_type:complete